MSYVSTTLDDFQGMPELVIEALKDLQYEVRDSVESILPVYRALTDYFGLKPAGST